MFLMLGIIYALMGLISVPLISAPDPPAAHQESSGRGITSFKPLQVLRLKWFYQVKCLVIIKICKIKHFEDLDWIFRHLRVGHHHWNLLQDIRPTIHKRWPFLLLSCCRSKPTEWILSDLLGSGLWQDWLQKKFPDNIPDSDHLRIKLTTTPSAR